MDLMYLLYSLQRKKWIILFCTVLGFLGGLVFTIFQKDTYPSVSQYSTGFTMEQKVKIKQEESFNAFEVDLRFNNVIETFKSPKVVGLLSYKLLLHELEDPHPFRKLSSEDRNTDEYKMANLDRVKQILRSKIRDMEIISPYEADDKRVYDLIKLYRYDEETVTKKLTVDRVQRTDFINISFKSENPELSAFVVNTLGEQFMRFFNSIYGVRTQDATAKLDSLTSTKKRELDSLTAKLKAFRDKIGTPNVADRASAAMSVVQEVTSNYQQEMAKLNNLRGELNAVNMQLRDFAGQTNNTTSGPNPANNQEILALQKRNSQLEMEKNGKDETDVKRIQDQIDANARRIVQLNGSTVSGNRTKDVEKQQDRKQSLISRKIELQEQISAAESNVQLFRKEKNSYETITQTGGGEEVILRAKEEELRIANLEYERLKSSLQASQDVDVNPVNSFKQTLVGQPAYKPETSYRVVIVILAGVVVFFLSIFILLLLEFLDGSFKTPSIFQRTTKLKLLSSLNRIDLKKKSLAEYFRAGEMGERSEDAIFVEHLRKLRFELESSGKKVFLVTSTKAKEGKTTVIEALASSFSLTKKKVLLIDANFSHNSLTQHFEAKPVLEQFSLNGENNAMDKFWSVTSMTSIPNTDLIGCKEGNYTPSEVLPKNSLLENLSRIAGNYDYVFVEGAALNSHADSKELARYVDGIIVVFSAKSSLRQADEDSIQYVKNTGDKFVGTVLNNVEKENLDM